MKEVMTPRPEHIIFAIRHLDEYSGHKEEETAARLVSEWLRDKVKEMLIAMLTKNTGKSREWVIKSEPFRRIMDSVDK